jgi:TonB-dependent starch-binding outer membrane protein SusC
MKKIGSLMNYRHLFACYSKLGKIMRISIFLILLTSLQAFALNNYAQTQKLDVKVNNATIEETLKIIEAESKFHFFYNTRDIRLNRKVTLELEEKSIHEILDILFLNTGITYTINKKQIVLSPERNRSVTPQNGREVTGTVNDAAGTPLAGVSVVVKSSGKGTITDIQGNYRLTDVLPGDILVFSFIGMETIEVPVTDRIMIDVIMEYTSFDIGEVVAIGYGTQRKRDITGAISTVTTEELNGIPVAGIDQALQGQVAGVMITQNYGSPGAGMQVRVRGIGTIGDSDPLYVIDGVPTKENINSLNTNDIASISILKDASAAAIYGARAANGVVLITTRKGKAGTTQVNFNAQYGVQNVANKLDLLTADEYADISDEALLNAGLEAVWNKPGQGVGTDWQNEIFRVAPFQKYDLSVTSGNEDTRYLLGLGYYDQAGIVHFSDFNRVNMRFNLDSKVSEKFTIGTNMNISHIAENLIDTEINGVVRSAIFQPPTIPVYNEDGTYAGPGPNEGDAQNPLGMADRSDMSSKKSQIFGNIFAEYDLMPNLKFKSSLGLNVYSKQVKNFDPTFAEGNANRTINNLTQQDFDYYDLTWENTLNFKKTFGKNKLGILAGNTLQESKTELLSGFREGFVYNDEFLQYLDAGSSNDQSRGTLQEWSLASFFGRINYAFDDKYLLSANTRLDGSSRFGSSNRWGIFPSVSAGWRISEESFFNVQAINDLKVRASWGQLGNQDIGLYAFSSNLQQTFYALGNPQELNVAYFPAADYNPDVKWETTTQQDIGLDLFAFNYKLFVAADYYVKNTTDMLLILPQPMTSGFSNTGYENLGEVQNKGWEFQLLWKDNIGEIRYNIGANLATLHNEVISLGTMSEPITAGLFFDMSTRTEVGHSIREFYGYVTDGVFQNQAEIDAHATQVGAVPGDIRFRDLNDDGAIDSDDRDFIGNPYPDFFYGLSAGLEYKHFDLSLLFQGQQGNDIYNATAFWLTNSGYNYNKGTAILDRWTGAGTSNFEPRVTTVDINQNTRGSDRYIEDGSYLRLKNLQLGFTLPEQVGTKLGISNARIYFSGYNLLTITDYTGYDPEVGAARATLGDRTVGFDEVTYPQSKSYILGLNLTF